MCVSSMSGSGPRLAARTFSKITRSRFGSYIGMEVVRFSLPIACAASARSLNSETICRSSSSIFLRQSSISMQSPYAARVLPRLLFQCHIRTVELEQFQSFRAIAKNMQRGFFLRKNHLSSSTPHHSIPEIAVTGLQNGRSRARPQTLDKSRDGAGRLMWSGALNVLLDDAHQRAANHRCVGELAHSGKMLRIRNAETHGNRQICVAAQARDEAFCVCGQRLLRSGDAGTRDGIDKSLRSCRDTLQSLVGTGRCGKKDRRKTVALEMGKIFAGFLDNHVGDQ